LTDPAESPRGAVRLLAGRPGAPPDNPALLAAMVAGPVEDDADSRLRLLSCLAAGSLLVPATEWNPEAESIEVFTIFDDAGTQVLHAFTDTEALLASSAAPPVEIAFDARPLLSAAVAQGCRRLVLNPAGPAVAAISGDDLVRVVGGDLPPPSPPRPVDESYVRAYAPHQRAALRERAARLVEEATAARRDGSSALARERYEAALADCRELGDAQHAAETLNDLGTLDMDLDRFESASDSLEEALRIWRMLANREGCGMAMVNLGWLDVQHGSFEDAIARADGSQLLLSLPALRRNLAMLYFRAGGECLANGLHDQARRCGNACHELAQELEDQEGQESAGVLLAEVQRAAGPSDPA
jgi:tetratricopeptide (TPR) repeat protein